MADVLNADDFKFVKDVEEKEKMIWNAAIETAAICAGSRSIKSIVLDNKDHELALYVQRAYVLTASEIRKLKK